MQEAFVVLSEREALQINPVVLAFLGDAVYSLWVREKLVVSGEGRASEFQRAAAEVESARGQSALIERILPLLTERETEIFKRGRNAKKATKSKHATVGEYNRSTGLEAVLGFLHLTGNGARIDELLSQMDELKGKPSPVGYKP
ncbi:MAG: Mini-ribonuclease 3 [Clostridia bacterium]|nr:Mini-ribonuclease 3 [Clostridia bacterium]